MRILLIVDCYFPSTKSGAKLVHDLGVEMNRQGHQVTVLTPSEHNLSDLELTSEDELLVVRVRNGQLKARPKFNAGCAKPVCQKRSGIVAWIFSARIRRT